MSIEDNTFDFKVQDRLKKECKDRPPLFPYDPLKNHLLLDMIAYCSQGNQEEAVLNLKTTLKFERDYEIACTNLGAFSMAFLGYYERGSRIIFEFWRKCFIQTKVAVQKKESLPRETWHFVIFREYARFLNSDNFANHDAFESEARVAVASLVNASDTFDNTYKAMMMTDSQSEN